MPVEMDDIKRRRQLREQQRQARQRQQRMLTIKLLIALIVLIGVGVTILSVAARRDQEPVRNPTETAAPGQTESQQEEVLRKPKRNPRRKKIKRSLPLPRQVT